MNPSERDEFLISQFLDGTLDADARGDVESRVAREPEFAALLRSHRGVTEAVKQGLDPVPEIDWQRFGAEVRRRCSTVDGGVLDESGRPLPDGRGSEISRGGEMTRESELGRGSAGLTVWRLFVPLAAAASIALTFTLLHGPQELGVGAGGDGAVARLVIEYPDGDSEDERVIVSYGPATDGALNDEVGRFDEPTTRVAIAAVGSHVRWTSLATAPRAR